MLSASQARQEEGHWEVQKGQGPSQQIWRQSQEEGTQCHIYTQICPFTCHGCRWIGFDKVRHWVFLITNAISLTLSRSGPREKWGISSTTWCSSTRLPTTSCTKKFPTTSSSHPLLCLRGWRSVALWPGTPSRSCSPKVNFFFFYFFFFLVNKHQNGAHWLRWKAHI